MKKGRAERYDRGNSPVRPTTVDAPLPPAPQIGRFAGHLQHTNDGVRVGFRPGSGMTGLRVAAPHPWVPAFAGTTVWVDVGGRRGRRLGISRTLPLGRGLRRNDGRGLAPSRRASGPALARSTGGFFAALKNDSGQGALECALSVPVYVLYARDTLRVGSHPAPMSGIGLSSAVLATSPASGLLNPQKRQPRHSK